LSVCIEKLARKAAVPEEAMSGYVDRVKEAYPSMNGLRRVEAEGA
jgi:hypothetical protein